MTDITSKNNIIDSRNVIERIKELEEDRDALEGTEREEWEESGDAEELSKLVDLFDSCASFSDWKYGAILVRDSYFVEFAKNEATECGLISDDASWPHNHIDWEAAADALKMDYSSVEFDGETYWTRG